MAFKLDFSCFNKYEAYLSGLAIAHEMGIKHLKNIEDSNLIICQSLEFSPEELSLAQIITLIQRLGGKFKTFEINHAQRIEEPLCGCSCNLGSLSHQSTKEMLPITIFLGKYFEEPSLDREDWRTPLKAKLVSSKGMTDSKEFKDHVLIP
jgi:hypothetical protein